MSGFVLSTLFPLSCKHLIIHPKTTNIYIQNNLFVWHNIDPLLQVTIFLWHIMLTLNYFLQLKVSQKKALATPRPWFMSKSRSKNSHESVAWFFYKQSLTYKKIIRIEIVVTHLLHKLSIRKCFLPVYLYPTTKAKQRILDII
jgi:hypothetical protein